MLSSAYLKTGAHQAIQALKHVPVKEVAIGAGLSTIGKSVGIFCRDAEALQHSERFNLTPQQIITQGNVLLGLSFAASMLTGAAVLAFTGPNKVMSVLAGVPGVFIAEQLSRNWGYGLGGQTMPGGVVPAQGNFLQRAWGTVQNAMKALTGERKAHSSTEKVNASRDFQPLSPHFPMAMPFPTQMEALRPMASVRSPMPMMMMPRFQSGPSSASVSASPAAQSAPPIPLSVRSLSALQGQQNPFQVSARRLEAQSHSA